MVQIRFDEHTAFQQLTPDQLLDAVESQGYRCDGRFLALNSYENRVYQIGLDDDEPIIAKFYRPQRWTDDAILEEHRFTLELSDNEIPVVAPLQNARCQTLHHHAAFRFALYPRRGGRTPELDNPQQLEIIGRFIARIHLLGATAPFHHRATIDIDSLGRQPAYFLPGCGFFPAALETAYCTIIDDLLTVIQKKFDLAGNVQTLRIHGDCHPANILWRDDTPHIVDFDDARTGPAVQDLWMYLSGDRAYQQARLGDLLDGYFQFREFELRELHLVEALRTLRMIYYAAWLARRWSDPAFQQAFPWFNSARYWDEHILSLREQRALLDEPALIY